MQCYRYTPLLTCALPLGVVERLSCLEGKVDDLQCEQDSQSTAIQDLQSGHDSLSQRMDRVETQSRGRSSGS